MANNSPWFDLKDAGRRTYSPATSRHSNLSLSDIFKPQLPSSGWNLGPYPVSNNGNQFTMSAFEPPSQSFSSGETDFRGRYGQIKSLDDQKNKLIEELIDRYDHLNELYKILSEDQARANEVVSLCQRREKTFQENIRRLKSLLDTCPFILILIDGNNLMFDESFLKRGEQGGRDAASKMHFEVSRYISRAMPELPSDAKVVTRIYASAELLAQEFRETVRMDGTSCIEDFITGFNNADSLFDFVDIGSGEENRDRKLCDVLNLHLHDYHCRQILLGLNPSSLGTMLNEIGRDDTTKSRVTLLVPFEDNFNNVSFGRCHMNGLFQTSKSGRTLKENRHALPISYSTPPSSRPISRTESAEAKELMPELPAAKVASVEDTSKSSPATSWASTVKNSVPVATPPQSVTTQSAIVTPTISRSSTPTVPRNRKGQRVDPIIKHDKDEVDRVKRKKWCNVHFLRNECPFGEGCTHVHTPKPTLQELQTLRLVARMAPCKEGSDCDDQKCIYGHICPAPEGKKGELCIFGENCRFPKELHGVDRIIVKTVKV